MKQSHLNPSELRLRGHRALWEPLGPVGFVRFMQQFVCRGDYTREREQWIDSVDLSVQVKSAARSQRTPRRAG
jgi:hypothetical protein